MEQQKRILRAANHTGSGCEQWLTGTEQNYVKCQRRQEVAWSGVEKRVTEEGELFTNEDVLVINILFKHRRQR